MGECDRGEVFGRGWMRMITATEARRRGLLVVEVGSCGYFGGRGLSRISMRRGRRGVVTSVGGPISFSGMVNIGGV